MNLLHIISVVFLYTTLIFAEQEGPDFWLDGSQKGKSKRKNPSKSEKDVLDSLSKAGIGSDTIDRPAKQFLLDVYQQLQKGDKLSDTLPVAGIQKEAIANADTIRSFTAKVPQYEGKGRVKFTFNLTSVSRSEKTQHAELHIRPVRAEHDRHVHRFKVATFNEDGRVGEKIMYRLSAKSKTYGGYLVFDLTDVIDDVLMKTRGDNERLARITIKHKEHHKNNKNKRSADSPTTISEDDGILILYTANKDFFKSFKSQVRSAASKISTRDSRKKRNTENRRSQRKSECAKKDMTIDFDKLGWGQWIIYPRHYNAHMCEGRCPSPIDWSLDPTNHSMLQSLARLQNKKVAKVCCVPTKLDPISMMYHEYDELVVRQHKDMSVGTCGCR